jgi:aminoglycoside phosphotransferase (APT) family kinase protein
LLSLHAQTSLHESIAEGSGFAKLAAMSLGEDFTGTMPVPAAQRFDETRLAAWLAEHVSGFGGAPHLAQFKGGQSNPTYLVEAGGRRYVLRRKPPGKLLPSAHAVDREYRIIAALGKTEVPVARALALCLDESVIGTSFYVMEHVEGRVFWDPALPGLTPPERREIYLAMNRTISDLHKLDYAVLGLGDFGRPGNYVRRQIERWTRQYLASETEKIPAMDRLIAWLPAHAPDDETTSIVHGDFRIDNLIFEAHAPRVLAVLDWELSTLGNPASDFAYHMMAWRLGPESYRGLLGQDFAALGIPDEDEYRALYCRRLGRDSIPHWDFYIAYNMFRFAAILQGIMGRVREGNAANVRAVESGARAKAIAEAGWQQVERMRERR